MESRLKSRIIKILENIVGEDNNQLDNSLSNVEEILLSILNGTAYSKYPRSRVEELLIAIKEEGGLPDIPILSTGEEALKAKVLGKDYIDIHNYFEYLISRWLGMSGSGYKTVTGQEITISDNEEPVVKSFRVNFSPLVQNGCFVDYSIIPITVNDLPIIIFAINDGHYTPVCSGYYDDSLSRFFIDKKYYWFDRVDSEFGDWFYSSKMKIEDFNPYERIIFNRSIASKVVKDPYGNTRIAIRASGITTIEEMNDYLVDNHTEMLLPLTKPMELYEAEAGVIGLNIGVENTIATVDGTTITLKYAVED